MSSMNSSRLSAYQGLAAVAAAGVGVGVTSDAQADLMIFDINEDMSFEANTGGGSIPPGELYSGSFEISMAFGDDRAEVGLLGKVWNVSSSGDALRFVDWGIDQPDSSFAFAMADGGSSKSALQNFINQTSVPAGFSQSATIAPGGLFVSASVNSGTKQSTLVDVGQVDGQFYIGFEYQNREMDDAIYGWIDITLTYDQVGRFSLAINRWAYESDAGRAAAIPSTMPVPGAGGLLALAFGAAGIRSRRERVA